MSARNEPTFLTSEKDLEVVCSKTVRAWKLEPKIKTNAKFSKDLNENI
jgi:hypothetical protein